MKKIIFISVLSLFAYTLMAQTPQAIKYQTVVRGSTGEILPNQYIGLQISIHEGSTSGTIVYQEIHYVTTNQFGLANLEIGTETPVIGTFPSIDWQTGLKFLEIELDPTGSSGFTSMGTTQLVSVPYALYAETSSNDGDWTIAGNDLYTSLPGNVGIGTSSPVNGKLEVIGTSDPGIFTSSAGSNGLHAESSAGGGFAAGFFNATNPGTYGIWTQSSDYEALFANTLSSTSPAIRANGEIAGVFNGKVGIGSQEPEFKLSLDNDGGILSKGEFGVGDTLKTTGNGARFIWYPQKAALRAGWVFDNNWDNDSIGDFSIALGSDTRASGELSIALGYSTIARGPKSTAMGMGSEASGFCSTAMGYFSKANGYGSIAMGWWSEASGFQSTAMGLSTNASGSSSTALGEETKAESRCATAIGRFNVGGGHNGWWIETDPIFEIGIGDSDTERINALTVLKNGKVGICTSTPAYQLDVDSGNILIRGANSFIANGDQANLFLGDPNHGIKATHSEGLRFWTYGTLDHDIRFQDHNGTDYMTIKMGSGNVGIGTSMPSAGKLEIIGGTSTAIDVSSDGSNTLQATSSAGGGFAAGYFNAINPGTYGIVAQSSDYDGLYVESSASSQAAIRAVGSSGAYAGIFDGFIGIGTTSPERKLHISDGFIRIDPGYALEMYHENGYQSNIATSIGSNNTYFMNMAGGGMDFSTGTSVGFTYPRLFIQNDGNIGIGTISPFMPLHINQNSISEGIRLEYSGSTYWDTYVDGAQDYNFAYNGFLKAYINDTDGSYIAVSDRNLKTDITPFPLVLEKVKQLQPCHYRFKDDMSGGNKSIGLIAQEVEPLFPEVVHEKDGIKAINYDAFAVIAIQAIKEQQAIIEDLKTRLEKLENK